MSALGQQQTFFSDASASKLVGGSQPAAASDIWCHEAQSFFRVTLA